MTVPHLGCESKLPSPLPWGEEWGEEFGIWCLPVGRGFGASFANGFLGKRK
jgi:hypothetical protein